MVLLFQSLNQYYWLQKVALIPEAASVLINQKKYLLFNFYFIIFVFIFALLIQALIFPF